MPSFLRVPMADRSVRLPAALDSRLVRLAFVRGIRLQTSIHDALRAYSAGATVEEEAAMSALDVPQVD